MEFKNGSIIRFDDGEIVGIIYDNPEANRTVIMDSNGWGGGINTTELIRNRTWELISEPGDVIQILSEMSELLNPSI